MAKKAIGNKTYEVEYVSKRINKSEAYFFYNFLNDYVGISSWFDRDLSDKTKSLFDSFMDCLYDDIGHLICDEFSGDYVVEFGFNKLGVFK